MINNNNHVSEWLGCYITDQKNNKLFLQASMVKRKPTTSNIKIKQVLQQFISNLCRVAKIPVCHQVLQDCHNLETRLLIVCFLCTSLLQSCHMLVQLVIFVWDVHFFMSNYFLISSSWSFCIYSSCISKTRMQEKTPS